MIMGKFYYFNTKTNKSQWVDHFRQAGKLRRGVGFGMPNADAEKSENA